MKLYTQLKRFVLIGIVNTLFAYLLYTLAIAVWSFSLSAAVLFSYLLGICFSYFTFRTFVFKEGERGWKSFARFIPTYLLLLLFNIIALDYLVEKHHMNKLLAQALIVPLCALISFLLNRLFIFRLWKKK